nr:MAG TPA: hypothetical protein [Caudoviricetes sp.]
MRLESVRRPFSWLYECIGNSGLFETSMGGIRKWKNNNF